MTAASATSGETLRRAVSVLAPPRLNTLLTCGWVNSAVSGRPMNAGGQPIPWFTYPAIDFLEPRVKPHWRVLEWGCGQSTLWWSQRVSSVTSIEHDVAWQANIRAHVPDNGQVVLVEEKGRYVEANGLPGPFDAIVIDGEYRNECARIAADRAGAGGIIVLDNSDRKAYRDGMVFLSDRGWKRLDLFGVLPTYLYRTCTTIFYRDEAFLRVDGFPCDHESSLGPTCGQVLGE